MESYHDCLGGLEELVEALREAGLSEVTFRSPRGSLVLRGEEGAAEVGGEAYPPAGPAPLVLLRSHCVGRWSRAGEAAARNVVEKDACLGTISTLLGEEGLKAPGPGRVEKWIIGEGEVAGYGDPLALFREVG